MSSFLEQASFISTLCVKVFMSNNSCSSLMVFAKAEGYMCGQFDMNICDKLALISAHWHSWQRGNIPHLLKTKSDNYLVPKMN
jgi:hypothetical protein